VWYTPRMVDRYAHLRLPPLTKDRIDDVTLDARAEILDRRMILEQSRNNAGRLELKLRDRAVRRVG